MKNCIFLFFFCVLFALIFPISATAELPGGEGSGISLYFYSEKYPTYFIVIEKQTQSLKLYQHQHQTQLLKSYTSATGENPGNKLVSGDSRTPEGVYFITEVYEDNKITVFGSRAFHLDYPNVFDIFAGRRGDGIFIHGTNKDLIPYSTNGCITLNNDDLDILAPYLKINAVPVIIVDSLPEEVTVQTMAPQNTKELLSEILDQLNLSIDDFSAGVIENLIFIRVGSQAIASVGYSIFDSKLVKYQYQKRAYFSRSTPDKWQMLEEVHKQKGVPSFLAIQPNKFKAPVAPEPVVTAVSTPSGVIASDDAPATSKLSTIEAGEELLSFVERWRKSWTKKDIETYMSCYSPTFTSGRLDLNGWRKKKSYLNKKYKYIKVSIKNIVVEYTPKGANVSFFQEYKSDKFETSGTKQLQLVNIDNRWLIQKEIM